MCTDVAVSVQCRLHSVYICAGSLLCLMSPGQLSSIKTNVDGSRVGCFDVAALHSTNCTVSS